MTSPNRLKIFKLFDEAHSTKSLVETSHKFASVFKSLDLKWCNSYNNTDYVPNHSNIYQMIKYQLVDLKIMIDKVEGPIRQTDNFYISSCRITTKVFYEDNMWILNIFMVIDGSEFTA